MKREFFLYLAVSVLALAVDISILYLGVVRLHSPTSAGGIGYSARHGRYIRILISRRALPNSGCEFPHSGLYLSTLTLNTTWFGAH